MPTVPTAPEAVALANIATYLQAKKNAGQTITGQPYVVAETGKPFAVVLSGSTYYAVGPEYLIPIQIVTATAMSATGTFCYFCVPPDVSILLTTLNILTNAGGTIDATHYWTATVVAKTGADSLGTSVTADTKLATADLDYPITITTFGTNPLPAGSYYVVVSMTKTSTPGNITVNAALRGRDILATLT